MRHPGLGILTALVILVSTSAGAQPLQDTRWIFYLNSGFSLPVSEGLSDFSKTGFNAGGGAGYILNTRMILQGYLDYNRYPMNDNKFLALHDLDPISASASGGNVHVTTFYLNLIVGGIRQEESRVAPYFIAGAGFFRFTRDEFEVTDTFTNARERVLADSENTFGIAGGGGVSISLNDRWSLLLEGKYQAGFTPQSSTQYFPVKVGLAFR